MPIYSIQPALESAMVAITREWSRQVQDQRITRLPLATFDLNECVNFQPNNIPDVSTAKSSDDGLQMLLDAVSAAGYGAVDNGTNPLNWTSQGVGDQQSGGTQLASDPEGEQIKEVQHLWCLT